MKRWIGFITMICMCLPYAADANNVKEHINVRAVSSAHEHRVVDTKLYLWSFEEHSKDKVNKVVIDAGHGGHDPGTHGATSVEKDIALSIALKTGELLSRLYPDIQISYTRTKDVFIPLHKRIAKANEEKADLFVSVHCNYVGNPHICGTETYVMGLHRAEENLNVAKRENAAVLLEDDFEANYDGYDPNSPIGHILLSAFQNVHLDNSINIAASIEEKLGARKSQRSRGVKQAGFVVLRQATMPSILVETGFLSNPKEEKYLMSKIGQTEISNGLSESIGEYFKLQKAAIPKEKTESSPVPNQTDQEKQAPQQSSYTIQIGVFSKPDKTIPGLQKSKLEPTVNKINQVYRYTVGTYPTKEVAKAALANLKSQGLKDGFVKKL